MTRADVCAYQADRKHSCIGRVARLQLKKAFQALAAKLANMQAHVCQNSCNHRVTTGAQHSPRLPSVHLTQLKRCQNAFRPACHPGKQRLREGACIVAAGSDPEPQPYRSGQVHLCSVPAVSHLFTHRCCTRLPPFIQVELDGDPGQWTGVN